MATAKEFENWIEEQKQIAAEDAAKIAAEPEAPRNARLQRRVDNINRLLPAYQALLAAMDGKPVIGQPYELAQSVDLEGQDYIDKIRALNAS